MKLLYKKSMFLLYSVLVFFTPLVVIPMTQESFEFPKMMVVYIISLLVLFIYVSYALYKEFFRVIALDSVSKIKSLNSIKNRSKVSQVLHKIKDSSFFKIVIPFILFSSVSLFFSQDIYTSIFGYYSRFNGGFLSLVSFLILSYVSYKTFDKNYYINLFFFSLLSLVLVSIYGIWQYYSNTSIIRTYSTFGQPNWLAQHLGMFLPLISYYYLKTPLIYSNLSDVFKDSIVVGLFTLVFYAFWLTFSMSAFFALLIAFLFLLASFYKSIYLKKVFIIAVISIIIMVYNFGFFKQRFSDVIFDIKNFVTLNIVNVSFVNNNFVYAQPQSETKNQVTIKDNNDAKNMYASYTVSDPGFIRRSIWESSINMILENPQVFLFGCGLQIFPYEFQQFRSPILNYTSEWDFVINRPHNYYLELFIEIGILGLLGYLFILKFMFDNSPLELKPSLLVFYITNMFGWPVVYTNVLFWMLFSYICYLKLARVK